MSSPALLAARSSSTSSSGAGGDGGTALLGGATAAAIADPSSDPELEDRLSALLASPDSDFSVARYINLALDRRRDRDDRDDDDDGGDDDDDEESRQQWLEQRMTSLALQLQMRTQSCHDEIGRIGAELRAVVPRCAADVGRIRAGLGGMEDDVRGMLGGMASGGDHRRSSSSSSAKATATTTADDAPGPDVGAGVGAASGEDGDGADDNGGDADDPLATLQSLLSLRTHLRSARSILSAASSWDETINSIPMLLSTSPPNLVDAVSALSQLERGARALAGMPEGRDERDAALSKLRTQLEALLKPQLLHALRRMDTRLGPLVQCVGMYGSLGKLGVMREEYVRMRPVEIHALWFGFGGGGGGGVKREEVADGGGGGGKKGRAEKSDRKPGGADEDEVEDFDFDEEDGDSSAAASSSRAPSPATTAGQFAQFLPKFYDAVLELLAKERAQSKAVFGPALAPSIVVRVLIECFRPIVASFGKRLEGMCPPPGVGGGRRGIDGGGGTAGGMEAIAAAYEFTVRFLSLAYDRMEAWNDGSATTTAATRDEGGVGGDARTREVRDPADDDGVDGGGTVRGAVRSAFLLVASPFLPYQRGLSEAEQRPMGEAASMVARDVRGVTSFEDAAERLGDLAPFMFPLAEGEDPHTRTHPFLCVAFFPIYRSHIDAMVLFLRNSQCHVVL